MSLPAKHLYEFGEFRLDPAERLLLRAGEPLPLTPKAFEMLVVLVSQSGRLLTKEELMRAVWGEAVVEENNLNKNIAALRKALGESVNEAGEGRKFIETVRGHGFRFMAPVAEIEVESQSGVRRAVVSAIPAPELEHDHDDAIPPAATRAALAPTLATPPPVIEQNHQPPTLWAKLGKPAVMLSLWLIAAAVTFWWLKERVVKTPGEMKLMPLISGGDIYCASLSPDGKFFVYVNTDEGGQSSHLWLRQLAGGQPLAIGPVLTLDQSVQGTTFAPDGQFVYFTLLDAHEPHGALYRVSLLGGAANKVLAEIVSPVAFSPDGQRLAFIRRERAGAPATSLIIADSTGGNERTLLTRNGPEFVGGPSWSPDGKEIACQLLHEATQTSEAVWTIIGVDPQNGATRLLTPQEWRGLGRFAWLSDGSGLVLAGTKPGEAGTARDPLWLIAQPTGVTRRLTPDTNRYSYDSLSVSQDGQTLLTISLNRPSQIWSVPVQGRGPQTRYEARDAAPLTTGNREGLAGLLTLADGRIVYGARTGERIALWQMDAAGKQAKELTIAPSFLEEVAAPLDGSFFVFASTFAGREHLFRVESDGANLRQLTGGAAYEVDSDISPDGRWIVYGSQPASGKSETSYLWKIPAAGGTPQRLTDYEAETPHVSPDGQWISFLYQDAETHLKLGIIPASVGGAPVKSFDFPSQAAFNVGSQWMPDGQALSYIVTKKYVSNIWAQPLDGSAPHPLTNFTSGVIYRYAFERGGQRLYVARGNPINDLLLLRDFR